MKYQQVSVVTLGILIATLAMPSFLTAQRGARENSLTAAPTSKEVYSWAKTAKSKLPDSTVWDRAKPKTETQRSMLRLVKRGQAIIERVITRGDTMPATEAANYDRQMRAVVEQLDKLSAGGGPGGDQPNDCFAGCDEQYPGWGGGHGWNRFWCKVACLRIEIHIG
jgi:hypothetical protein